MTTFLVSNIDFKQECVFSLFHMCVYLAVLGPSCGTQGLNCPTACGFASTRPGTESSLPLWKADSQPQPPEKSQEYVFDQIFECRLSQAYH